MRNVIRLRVRLFLQYKRQHATYIEPGVLLNTPVLFSHYLSPLLSAMQLDFSSMEATCAFELGRDRCPIVSKLHNKAI